MTDALRTLVRSLPRRPGIYMFKGARGTVLYVGKAQSLKARVSQYLNVGRLEPTKRQLVREAVDVDTIVTTNETEALALEASLIQRHEPPYNVRLVDDSSYLYVRISRETYPTVELVRRVQPDGAWYRGPFPSALSIRRTLKEARHLFPWCNTPDPRQSKGRACFAYHLGLCPGMCVGAVTIEEYQRSLAGLQRFLDGDVRKALAALRERMAAASQTEHFEQAAKARDALTAIQRVVTPQHVVTPRRESVEAVGIAHRGIHAVAVALSVRDGRVTGVRPFTLLVPSDETPPEILRSFLLSYLSRSADGTPQMLLPYDVADEQALQKAYNHALSAPRRGWKRRLLELASANAEEALTRTTAELESPAALRDALQALKEAVPLDFIPHRIEAYDVSNIQGTLATGSMIVFQDGKPKRSAYRKFKMALAGAPNDTGMMREMLQRRFGRHAKSAQGSVGSEQRTERQVRTLRTAHSSLLTAHSEWPLPDLIILDGGKGQLNAARDALRERRLDIPTAALAKREEELFVKGPRDGAFRMIRLPRTSPALYLLQRLRDEAHRFTLSYHQLLRKKRMTRSILEEIPGVGAVTRKELLRTFGSLRAIRAASESALAGIVGPKLAKTVYSFLH